MRFFGRSKKDAAVEAGKAMGRAAQKDKTTDEGMSKASVGSKSLDKNSSYGRNKVVDSTKADPLLVEKADSSDEELMVIDHDPSSVDRNASIDPELQDNRSRLTEDDDAAKSNSYSTLEEKSTVDQEMAYSVMKVGPLSNPEPMVNGQLVHWKFTAEEGPWPLRILSVTAAIGVAVTSILPYFLDYLEVHVGNIIMSAITFVASILIIFLDGRFSFVRNPLGCRATLRTMIIKSVNSLKLVWGRGVLFIMVGLLQIAQMCLMTYISGGIMILIGVIALIIGGSASDNLSRLRSSLTDDEYLWNEFTKHDYNQDGYLNPSEFANFVWALGLEFDDVYNLKAFNAMDQDHNLKISFEDFQRWWAQCTDADDQMTYTPEQELAAYRQHTTPKSSTQATPKGFFKEGDKV